MSITSNTISTDNIEMTIFILGGMVVNNDCDWLVLFELLEDDCCCEDTEELIGTDCEIGGICVAVDPVRDDKRCGPGSFAIGVDIRGAGVSGIVDLRP